MRGQGSNRTDNLLTRFVSRALSALSFVFSAHKTNIPRGLFLWARAIQEFEGWFPGSRSFRNNNPGNLRDSRFASGKDKDGFAAFDSFTEGWDALIYQLELATHTAPDSRTSAFYKPTDTLLEFAHKWAPASDGNDPEAFARFLAGRLGVTIDTPIEELVD